MSFKTSRIITHVQAGGTFVVPEGANQIYLYNNGGADGTFRSLGSQLFGISSVPVTLPDGVQFAFEYNGKAYDSIEIDAAGTTIEIVAVY